MKVNIEILNYRKEKGYVDKVLNNVINTFKNRVNSVGNRQTMFRRLFGGVTVSGCFLFHKTPEKSEYWYKKELEEEKLYDKEKVQKALIDLDI